MAVLADTANGDVARNALGMVSGSSSDGGTAPLVQAGLLDALVSAFDSERFPEHADVVGHVCRVVRCLGMAPGLEMVLFERGLGRPR